MYIQICYCGYPLFENIYVAEDHGHVNEEESEAGQQQRRVGVHHVVDLIVVARTASLQKYDSRQTAPRKHVTIYNQGRRNGSAQG